MKRPPLDAHRVLSALELLVAATPAMLLTLASLPLLPLAWQAFRGGRLPPVVPLLAAGGLWAMPVLWGILAERVIWGEVPQPRAGVLLRLYVASAVLSGTGAAAGLLVTWWRWPFGAIACVCLLTTAHQAPYLWRRFFARRDGMACTKEA